MRFSQVAYDILAQATQQSLKKSFESIEKQIDALPNGRPKALSLTALEEAYMWADKAIRDDQLQRLSTEIEEQVEQGDE